MVSVDVHTGLVHLHTCTLNIYAQIDQPSLYILYSVTMATKYCWWDGGDNNDNGDVDVASFPVPCPAFRRLQYGKVLQATKSWVWDWVRG